MSINAECHYFDSLRQCLQFTLLRCRVLPFMSVSEEVPHPAYSPNLAPFDFGLFPILKCYSKKFSSDKELTSTREQCMRKTKAAIWKIMNSCFGNKKSALQFMVTRLKNTCCFPGTVLSKWNDEVQRILGDCQGVGWSNRTESFAMV